MLEPVPELTAKWLELSDWDAEFESEWSDLIDRCPTASIFETPEWVGPWWRWLGRGRLRLLSVTRGRRVVALVPLVEDVERYFGLRTTTLKFAGEPHADRLGLIHDPNDAAGLVMAAEAIAREAESVDIVRLTEMSEGEPDERAVVEAARACTVPLAKRTWSRSPVLRLERPWEEISAAYPKSLRTRLRRARSRQNADGGFSFARWQPDPAEVPTLLERFRDLENRSWKGQDGVGVFGPQDRWEFMADVSLRFARRRWLDVATLSRGSDLVAYRYGFRYRGVFLDYNLAHDPDASRYAPGRTLLDDVIRDSHRLGLQAVDASRGELRTPHLLADWTPDSRWHSKVMLFGPTVVGRAASLVEKTGKPLMRKIMRRKIPTATGAS